MSPLPGGPRPRYANARRAISRGLEITERLLPARTGIIERNREDVARAAQSKAQREAEAETWIAGVRARKARK